MAEMMAYSSHSGQETLFAVRNTDHARRRTMLRMSKPLPLSQVLITNIQVLKRYKGWSNRDLSRESGVSDRMIGKILNGDSEPTTATIEKIATAFKVAPWQLLMHGLDPETCNAQKLGGIFDAYLATDDDGRRMIDTTAGFASKRSANANAAPDGDKKKNSGR